jgi:hypothetical protein
MYERRSPVPLAGGNRAGVDTGNDTCPDTRSGTQLQHLTRLHRQYLVCCLHRLGDRVTFEFIDELAGHHPEIQADLDARLAKFAAADTALLRWTGADRFAPSPLRAVGGER